MALATLLSRAQNGLAADQVTVEVHLSGGLPGLSIVGLPEAAVREAKDRVRAAILNCGYPYPARRITVNLAPADLPKEGGRFDLAIALGILAASGEIPAELLDGVEVLGELSLSGEIRAVRGALPAALQCARAGRRLLLPRDNAAEAALAGCPVIATRVDGLPEVVQHERTGLCIEPTSPSAALADLETALEPRVDCVYDPIADRIGAPRFIDPADLADAVAALAGDGDRLARFSANAIADAAGRLSYTRHMDDVHAALGSM